MSYIEDTATAVKMGITRVSAPVYAFAPRLNQGQVVDHSPKRY